MANDKNRKEVSKQEHIKVKEISAMKNGYPMQVEGIGKVIIKSVYGLDSKRTANGVKSLLVNKYGLRKQIIRHYNSLDKGAEKNGHSMQLKILAKQPGDVVICYLLGLSGPICFVISCSYDPDSAVLPCL
ncbi:hypothetical protein OAM69_05315 [bacterium]|nr:hypothetical protein [bacterium]